MNRIGIGVGVGMKKKPSGGIPFPEDALFWLDGTIIYQSGNYYFKDKTNNGRNFLITGKDFTISGFPYKSAATISAPAGDSALIAADLNGFYYTSGTPNQIPIVACFQNTDYANRNFFRHIAQGVDANGVETSEAMVVDMVLYAHAKTGDSLTKCNTYYEVPVEQTSNVKWVAPASLGGSNSNAGTKAAPYLTFAYALGISGVTKIYATSGTHVADNYIDITKGISIQCTGNTIIDPTNASYAMYIHKSTTSDAFSISNCKLVGSYSGIYLAANNTNNTLNLVHFSNSSTYDIWYSDGITININFCKVNKRLYFSTGLNVNGSLVYQIVGSTGTVKNITLRNSKITSTVLIGNAGTTNIYGNTFVDSLISLQTNSTVVNFFNNNYTVTHASASHAINITTACNFYNNTITSTNIYSGYNVVNIEQKDCNVYNNIFSSYSTNAYADLCITGSSSVATTANVYNNKIKHRGLGGYDIKIGAETGSSKILINASVYNNVCLGATYFDDTILPANSTTHMIFVGSCQTFNVRYNYCNGGSPGIAIKGDGTFDLTDAFVGYNICKDNNNNYILQGVKNLILQNCISIQTKNILRHYSFGEAITGVCENVGLKNCIAYGLGSNTNAISIATGSMSGFVSDYNDIYIPNKSGWVSNPLGYNVSQWLSNGFDTNSIFIDPKITGLIPSELGLNVGESHAETNGLNTNTDWGTDSQIPTVQTIEQGENWSIGAYIIN